MTLQQRLARIKLLVCDFDGVFTDNNVYTFADGSEAIRTSRADGIGIERLKMLGVRVLVVTGELEGIVDVRCKKLGLQVIHADMVTKRQWLDRLLDSFWAAQDTPLRMDNIAYIGNDVNDLECLRAVGVPLVVADAETALVKVGALRTPNEAYADHWDGSLYWLGHAYQLTRNGGDGAVREACDLIADAIEAAK